MFFGDEVANAIKHGLKIFAIDTTIVSMKIEYFKKGLSLGCF